MIISGHNCYIVQFFMLLYNILTRWSCRNKNHVDRTSDGKDISPESLGSSATLGGACGFLRRFGTPLDSARRELSNDVGSVENGRRNLRLIFKERERK